MLLSNECIQTVMAPLTKRGDKYCAPFFDTNRPPKRRRFSLKTSRKSIARRKLVSLEEDFERSTLAPWTDDQEERKEITIKNARDRIIDTPPANAGRFLDDLPALSRVHRDTCAAAVFSSPDYTSRACGQCHEASYLGEPRILPFPAWRLWDGEAFASPCPSGAHSHK